MEQEKQLNIHKIMRAANHAHGMWITHLNFAANVI